MASDWVITFTFDAEPAVATMDRWEDALSAADGSVARIPDRGVEVTIYVSGQLAMPDATTLAADTVNRVVGAEPVGMEVLREAQWQRRADSPTMPELMAAAEIAVELGVSRQRVHQLRELSAFPAPLVELRGGAVWDAAAVRKFADAWDRRPGRPAGHPTSPSRPAS